MLILAPDFARRIDLPGAGPCPRPVDIDRSHTGFSTLVSLRVYSFARDMVIDGEAEGDEVFIVLMRGAADIAVDPRGARIGTFPLRAGGGARAVYLPPHAAYRLTAVGDCDIAYARSQPSKAPLPEARSFIADAEGLNVGDYATTMDIVLASVPDGEAVALLGDDGHAPERLVHVRAERGGMATVAGERLGDWGSAVFDAGEHAIMLVEQGIVDILTVSAKAPKAVAEGLD